MLFYLPKKGRQTRSMMPLSFKQLLNYIIILSLLGFILAYWNKDNLPQTDVLLPDLYQQPVQTKTDETPFSLSFGGNEVDIKPLAHYEMRALVTSLSDSNVLLTDHEDNNINVRDVCVIWGHNLTPELLSHLTTSNGLFSCQFDVASPFQYNKFFYITNAVNIHMITDRPEFRKIINEMRTGDQIYIKGLLVSYQLPQWGSFWRTSSVIDGTSVCKVIYLEDVKILARGNPGWNLLYQLSKWTFIISLILCLIIFIFGPVEQQIS